MEKNKKGFTLIELLVVISIIGLLSTISVVALNGARKKGRDANRVSNIKQVQTALELYFNDEYAYPIEIAAVTLGATGQLALCGGATPGFKDACGTDKTYMGIIPANPTPGGAAYTYAISTGVTYEITFTLEEDTGGLAAGAYTASPNGIAKN